jgi:hypothetical protein
MEKTRERAILTFVEFLHDSLAYKKKHAFGRAPAPAMLSSGYHPI